MSRKEPAKNIECPKCRYQGMKELSEDRDGYVHLQCLNVDCEFISGYVPGTLITVLEDK